MKFEVVTQADYVLNSCGRPVPPAGFRFVDLPRYIPYVAEIGQVATLLVFIPDVGLVYTFTAIAAGVAGNLVSFAMTGQGTPNLSLEISVVGNAISVQLATDGGGNPTSTFGDVFTLLTSTPAVLALVRIVNGAFSGLFALNFGPAFLTGGVGGGSAGASQGRASNNSNTLFICKGITLVNSCDVKIKWPNGRYLTQNPLRRNTGDGGGPPDGYGPSNWAFDKSVTIDRGERIGVEVSGPSGTVSIQFWGMLRYMIREKDAAELEASGGAACLVGYPTPAPTRGRLALMADPIKALESRDRIMCGPNQNIMAPEWALGNQCALETPAGYEDESYTFESQEIRVAIGDESNGNALAIPGADDMVIRRLRVKATYAEGVTAGVPLIQLRLPNGYSVTGGDFIDFASSSAWYPLFTQLWISGQGAGGRLILDVTNKDGAGNGDIITVVEFDAAKRRKVA